MPFYQTKQNAKMFLEKAGMIKIAKYCWAFRYYLRHINCQFMSALRSRGFKDKRFIQLKTFENIHAGERCFIVCTGPSLRLEDLNRLKNEYTFSMNSIIKLFPDTDWRPTYYVIQDSNAFSLLKGEIIATDLNAKFACDRLVREHKVSHDLISFPFDFLNHFNPNPQRLKKNDKYIFSPNAYEIVYDGHTVTYSAMQLAVYMGFREIVLLGCDCNYHGEKKYFSNVEYDQQIDVDDYAEYRMMLAYETARQYADAHGIKIYNATRGGKLEVFERVDFDSLFSEA